MLIPSADRKQSLQLTFFAALVAVLAFAPPPAAQTASATLSVDREEIAVTGSGTVYLSWKIQKFVVYNAYYPHP